MVQIPDLSMVSLIRSMCSTTSEGRVINEVIKKLRKAADALDELMDVMPSANMKAARSIRTKVDKNLRDERGFGKTPILIQGEWKAANKKQEEGRLSRKKKHWTDRKSV